MTKLALLLALAASASSGQQFEAAFVKHYDHKNDRNTPWGPQPLFDCHLGPGQLQYNCTGPASRLIAEALDLQKFQFNDNDKQPGAEYALTAKLSKPAKRFQIDAMLADYLQNQMGVRYHFEKRSVKGEFLTVVNKELLKKLPESHDDIPMADVFKFGGRDIRWSDFVEREMIDGHETLKFRNINFQLLVEVLEQYFNLPIINDTGLNTRFDITLRFQWPQSGEPLQLSDTKKFLAQYGLALQTRTGPIDYLVIDAVAPEGKFIE